MSIFTKYILIPCAPLQAAANSILSGLNRASKAKKREKGKKGEGSDKSKGKKDPK